MSCMLVGEYRDLSEALNFETQASILYSLEDIHRGPVLRVIGSFLEQKGAVQLSGRDLCIPNPIPRINLKGGYL